MFSRPWFFVVLLASVTACKAENTNAPQTEAKKAASDNRAFIDYVPTGWILQEQRIIDADIDGNGTKDAILTLIEDERLNKGDIPSDDDERALLVLLGDKNGKYQRSSFAKNVLLCASCAGMMGMFESKEQGTIHYDHEHNVFSILWLSGSRDSVDVDIRFGFNVQLKQFVLLSDSLEKRDRVQGKSTITKRDFVAGTKTVDGKVSKLEKRIIPIEAVKYFDYLNSDSH